MSIDLKTYPKDLQYSSEMLGDALEKMTFGSYAERHPHEGKMIKCPFCKKRRRQFSKIPCCTSFWSK